MIVSETQVVSQKLSIAKADLETWGTILVNEKSVEYSGLEALVLGDTIKNVGSADFPGWRRPLIKNKVVPLHLQTHAGPAFTVRLAWL